MKKSLLLKAALAAVLVAVVMLCSSSSKKKLFDFNGTWYVGSAVNAEIAGEPYFYVKLVQTDNQISGTYYSVTAKMARVDGRNGNKVTGYVKKNIAYVTFSSEEWCGGGTATITPSSDNTVVWHIRSEEKVPNKDFGHWAPSHAKLTRR
jgi:hypothetical protein